MYLLSLLGDLSTILLVSTALNSLCTFANSVSVAVHASFNAAPFLLELLETAAEENSTSYFPLLDKIADGYFAEDATEEELYMRFLETLRNDGHITDPDTLSSFQFALAVHSAAPRIEAHYQYYNTSVETSLMIAQDAACPVWVHFDGKQYCSPKLDRAQQDIGGLGGYDKLPFDRVLGELADSHSSVLYADVTSPFFGQFHRTLSRTARDGHTSYRIRYRPSPTSPAEQLVVSGYGAELALKRTDYIVIDDRGADKDQEFEKAEQAVNEEAAVEEKEILDLKPLTSTDLLGLGLKTGSYVMGSEDRFGTLIKVSQDFPKYSLPISKYNASLHFSEEHVKNRNLFLPAGYNIIWMNGVQLDARQMDAFSLLEQLRRERRLVTNLKKLGFSGSEAISLLSHSAIADSKVESVSQRYDYRDKIEGGTVIIWLNDIEKDSRYASWPMQATALLQRTYPGQLPTVRRDISNLIIVLDLTDLQDIELLVESLQSFVKRKVPIRFGIVPSLRSPAAVEQSKIIYHLQDAYGLGGVLQYLEASIQGKRATGPSKAIFDQTTEVRSLRRNRTTLPYHAILDSDDSRLRLGKLQHYLDRLGAAGPFPPLFVNGLALPRNEGWLQAMSQRVEFDLRSIQQAVFDEVIGDGHWLAGKFLEGAASYRNALIIPEDESSIKIIDVGKLSTDHHALLEGLPRLVVNDESSKQSWAHLVVVADLDSIGGARLAEEAMKFAKENGQVEIWLMHSSSPVSLHTDKNAVSNAICSLALSNVELEPDDLINALKGAPIPDDVPIPKYEVNDATAYWLSIQPLIRDLGLQPGEQGVLLNGRLIGPIPPSNKFASAEFEKLLEYERGKRMTPTIAALTHLNLQDRITSPLSAAKLYSLIALSTTSDVPEGVFDAPSTVRLNRYDRWDEDHSAICTGDHSTASIQLVASIDPTSEIAQRWIPILKVLSELSGVHLKLFLNPKDRMQELPVKRFYRYVLDSKPRFAEDGALQNLRATFDGLPKEALLNLALDVPPAWLVAPKDSIYDLDNIKLSALRNGSSVHATYELEHILIEGHSRDVTLGPPPRGAQLLLGTQKDIHFADTIIMANLGYFQFKANPGYWNIQLQEGRSQKIFNIDSAGAQGYSAKQGDESTEIALMSFQGKTLFPRLSRKPGQETEDVLEEGAKPGSAMNYISKSLKFAESVLSNVGLTPKPQQADINIFSVASGHLYERMLNIMMVSVMRHTTHSVKFWFIEQFLSPSFKSFLPHLAATYHFDYEMVTYKWPHWLRAQKEKQREIWGYKILFLDVLFPLSLDKVIFVDADQIVRTDMYDLVTHDLEGAPYGFTPMCDSRTEMEGFRFWKQGYWKTFLRGLPYHISALYVVDLRKFRQIAAGDRLRQQYHTLSADPASLSNLDQDLPNHMQMMLPIHSLPQEWLWCETWCSDESLKQARTIDLCNNPLTKEPKLERARRQVPEWNVYDEEIAEVMRKAKEISHAGGNNGTHEGQDAQLKFTPLTTARDEL